MGVHPGTQFQVEGARGDHGGIPPPRGAAGGVEIEQTGGHEEKPVHVYLYEKERVRGVILVD